jgi:hypothetical protein
MHPSVHPSTDAIPNVSHRRSRDNRRRQIAGKLWTQSTHKKFAARRGREPLRVTVDRSCIKDFLARWFLEVPGDPLVPFIAHQTEGQFHRQTDDEGPPTHFCNPRRQVVLAKGRRTGVPAWRCVPADLQVLFGVLALADAGEAVAFTLDLGTKLLERLVAGTKTARDEVRNRISRDLKSQFGLDVPFVVVLEVNWRGRLHAHGVVGVGLKDEARLVAALRKAGGQWTATNGEHHQVKVTDMPCPVGWSDYITQSLLRLPAEQHGDWIGWSWPAIRAAKHLHDCVRSFWFRSRHDLDIHHSMHFLTGDTSLADDLRSLSL